ncbi:DegT/DnrJ/EryC1/StrS family aminotransferase [Anaerocolumna chitinilytica]|uniref:Aminotransferase n=1 Tax=Anaerocolumna chitinilytica TaxID=1727145 RepID=A0A7M3SA74_9FIRM|nr:DegT/DnrJ/EryC1/StrS family aminotransferase [Anaerocolumna chitinilytica]BCK01492.1 aminotransferase [Anaerocolumna chitinilytica]
MSKLAVLGGEPKLNKKEINSMWPVWNQSDLSNLNQTLNSGTWCRLGYDNWNDSTTGRFERKFANFTGGHNVITVSNGTLALLLAMKALGVRPGDEILVSSATFIGTVTPIATLGAVPVFVDVSPNYINMDPKCCEARVTSRTKGVVVVHLAGFPADMDGINEVCKKHNLFLIEDCAQAVGTMWRGNHVGTLGDVGCFSFQQGKILTAGEGGAVIAQNDDIAGELFAFHNFESVVGAPNIKKLQMSLNMRLSEWQGSILLAQFDRLEEQLKHREENVKKLLSLLDEDGAIIPMKLPEQCNKLGFFYYPFIYNDKNMCGLSRENFFDIINAEGIHLWEGHTEPVYMRPTLLNNPCEYKNDGCPEAELLSTKSVVLGHKFFLGPEEWMDKFAEALRDIKKNITTLKSKYEN